MNDAAEGKDGRIQVIWAQLKDQVGKDIKQLKETLPIVFWSLHFSEDALDLTQEDNFELRVDPGRIDLLEPLFFKASDQETKRVMLEKLLARDKDCYYPEEIVDYYFACVKANLIDCCQRLVDILRYDISSRAGLRSWQKAYRTVAKAMEDSWHPDLVKVVQICLARNGSLLIQEFELE